MKRAHATSSVYEEGSGSKRSMEGGTVGEYSSKSARMSATRTNGLRARKAPIDRTIMTRSMSLKTTAQKKEKEFWLEVIDLDQDEEENVNDDTNNKAAEEEEQQQPAANEVAEKKGEDEVEMLTMDDFPFPWCSEEAFSWCKGYECGWSCSWDVMSGDHWLPRADSVEAAWSDDLWLKKQQ